MKKTLIIFLIVYTVLASFNYSYSWDSEAAKYYPLAVGNQWSYHIIHRSGPSCIMFGNQYDYLVRVLSDTLMPNGKKYYKIQGPAITFQRIDSVTMNVYQYSGGSECLRDSLMARVGNYYRCCRVASSNIPYFLQDTGSISFAGSLRSYRNMNGGALVGHHYMLMYGIGTYSENICEGNFGSITSLNGCIINGVQYGQIISGLTTINSEIPIDFNLLQNYPNPFNPTTNIKFQIPKSGFVKLMIFDVRGKEVQTLVNQQLLPGTYEADFDGSSLPSGVYYYRLEAEDPSTPLRVAETKKMVLIK